MATSVHTHARNLSSVALGLISYDIATWAVVFLSPESELPVPDVTALSRDENVSRDATRRQVTSGGDWAFSPVSHPPNLTLCTMSTLNKLAIRGIRSFDDKGIAVIEFFSPVTVIVGHNGSGKTTIIECLKYATTGDQPAGTRGGAFVHDPKMANEKEVKAQVKLRFFAANGQRMQAVRNLSVTLKKTAGMTMKTLESILALDNGNSEKSGKVRCLDIDTSPPRLKLT